MLWSEMTEGELVLHGCKVWDRETHKGVEYIHYLIPVERYDDLEPGDVLVDIMGAEVTVYEDYQDTRSENYIDNDHRFGCISFGVIVQKPIVQEE